MFTLHKSKCVSPQSAHKLLHPGTLVCTLPAFPDTCPQYLLFATFHWDFTCLQCAPDPASCICKCRFLDFLAPCGTLLPSRTLAHTCTCLASASSDSAARCASCSCKHIFRACTSLLAHNLPCNLPCMLATGLGPACRYTCPTITGNPKTNTQKCAHTCTHAHMHAHCTHAHMYLPSWHSPVRPQSSLQHSGHWPWPCPQVHLPNNKWHSKVHTFTHAHTTFTFRLGILLSGHSPHCSSLATGPGPACRNTCPTITGNPKINAHTCTHVCTHAHTHTQHVPSVLAFSCPATVLLAAFWPLEAFPMLAQAQTW